MKRIVFGILPLIGCLLASGCACGNQGAAVGTTESVTGSSAATAPEEPPAPQMDVRGPPLYDKEAWISGYWTWSDTHWVWLPGHWENRPSMDSVWMPGHWDKNPAGTDWVWTPGYWQ